MALAQAPSKDSSQASSKASTQTLSRAPVGTPWRENYIYLINKTSKCTTYNYTTTN